MDAAPSHTELRKNSHQGVKPRSTIVLPTRPLLTRRRHWRNRRRVRTSGRSGYNYFRDYDPVTGRYVESDPIGLLDGLNTYGYVAGNPLALSDPLGLFQVDPASCAANPRICKRIHQFAKKITRRQREAFKEVRCTTDEQIDLGLTPGYGPIVRIDDLANPLSPANFLARQMLLTIDPKKVGNARFMSEFEGGFYQVLGHEFAHYLDAVVTGNAAGGTREEGNEWEEKVYGKR